jgi:hypothetical protein
VADSRSRGARYAAVAAVLVLATACSEDPPTPAPVEAAPSTSASPSATPSPSGAPAMPAEAKGTSRKAAVAFVHHVIDVLNYSAANLDSASVRRISTKSCVPCRSLRNYLQMLRSRGDSVHGGAWKPVETLVPRTSGRTRQIHVVVDYGKQVVRRSDNSARSRSKAGRTLYTFSLEPAATGWLLNNLQRGDS